MAIIGLQKGSGKKSRVRKKSVKSPGILIWIMSGNPVIVVTVIFIIAISIAMYVATLWKCAY